MKSRRLMLIAAAALMSGCDKFVMPGKTAAESFKNIDITGSEYARKLDLPDQNGKLTSLAEFKGKVVVVFFGYTQCPDVCPGTMAELAQIKKALGKDGERLQGVFITVDPERDTTEILNAYMGSFDPSFVALRGTLEQTTALAKEFKVFFAKVPGKAEGSYTMDHTAGSYVFDTQGKIRLFVRYGSGVELLVSDLKTLLTAA